MTLALRYAARTDRGQLRHDNEDSLYAGPRLLAVADGMGGHVGGEIASRVVIETVRGLDQAPAEDEAAALSDAVQAANTQLRRMVADDPDLDGMGTTLTAVLFDGAVLRLAHVGDSRAYQLSDGDLTKITHDDTFVQALVDEGQLTEAQAAVHPQRHMILRALTGLDVEVGVDEIPARVGDRYLLASDGLFDVVGADAIAETIADGDLDGAVAGLVELANAAGGPDNISCVLAEVVDGPGDTEPIVAGAVAAPRPPGPTADASTESTSEASDAEAPDDDLPSDEPPSDEPADERRGLLARIFGRRTQPRPADDTSESQVPDRRPDGSEDAQPGRREELP